MLISQVDAQTLFGVTDRPDDREVNLVDSRKGNILTWSMSEDLRL